MIISIFFADPGVRAQRLAEEIYFKRKPVAVGYFRFWQANRIGRRRSDALEAALDLTDIGVLLIDRADRIVFANDAGEKILGSGEALKRSDGRIRAIDLSESACLRVALDHVASGEGASKMDSAVVLAVRRKGGPPLTVSLLAAKTQPLEPSDVAAIMFIVDPQLDTVRMLEPVCGLYHLSRTETKLVSYLAQGRTLGAASKIMKIKEQTARGYLKQIFIKTSTNRQSELIVLMLSSVVRMRNGLTQITLGRSDIFRPREMVSLY